MKRYTILCLFFLFALHAKGQEPWTRLEQVAIALSYEIPASWYVKGVFLPQKCQCTGGTFNTSKSGKLNMLIYHSNTEDMDSLKRQDVWGYHFVEPASPPQASVFLRRGQDLHYELQVSLWEEDKELMVLRYSLFFANEPYLIYFWAEAQELEAYQEPIERILSSLQRVEKP